MYERDSTKPTQLVTSYHRPASAFSSLAPRWHGLNPASDQFASSQECQGEFHQ